MADVQSLQADNEGAAAQRGTDRESIFLGAQLVLRDSIAPANVRVRNISPGGMMIDFSGFVEANDPVVIDIKGIGPVTGKVAWINAGKIGIAFDRLVDPGLVRIRTSEPSNQVRYSATMISNERRPGLAVR